MRAPRTPASRRRVAANRPMPMQGPRQPLGRHIVLVGRMIGRAFEAALAAAGGSLPMWLVLWTLEAAEFVTQRELAQAVGIREPTLTHHLDNLESSGLVRRVRESGDRRAIRVELTDAGHDMFGRLGELAEGFNNQLATGITGADERQLRRILDRLASNVGTLIEPD